MPELDELYQEIILDHNRRPRNYGVLQHPTHRAEGNNPLCGDEVTVFVRLEGEVIRELTFDGQGCAISRASASLMTTKLKGRTLAEARTLMREVHDLLTGPDSTEPSLDDHLGDLAALAGVRKFAVRVKCATLAWHTLEAALADHARATTE